MPGTRINDLVGDSIRRIISLTYPGRKIRQRLRPSEWIQYYGPKDAVKSPNVSVSSPYTALCLFEPKPRTIYPEDTDTLGLFTASYGP